MAKACRRVSPGPKFILSGMRRERSATTNESDQSQPVVTYDPVKLANEHPRIGSWGV